MSQAKKEMTNRIEELEAVNEQLSKHLRDKEEREEMLNFQLGRNQSAAEDVIGRLKEELQKEKEVFECYKGLASRCEQA